MLFLCVDQNNKFIIKQTSESVQCMVLARDPSTRLLDGLFHLWTGKKIRNKKN